MIIGAFNNLFVDFARSRQHICGYAGSVVSLGVLVEFEVSIFAKGSGHMVEVRHIHGCRFAFGNFADNFAKELGVVYEGGGRSISFAPPSLPADFSNIEVPVSVEVQNCDFLHSRIEQGAPRESVLQGVRSVGAMASDEEQKRQFETGGHAIKLANQTATIFKKSDDIEIRVAAIFTLANIVELKSVCDSIRTIIGSILVETDAVNDPNAHVRREATRAAVALSS